LHHTKNFPGSLIRGYDQCNHLFANKEAYWNHLPRLRGISVLQYNTNMKYIVCTAVHSHLVRISSYTVAQLRLIKCTPLPKFILPKLFVQLRHNPSLQARILLYYGFKTVMLSGRALHDSCIVHAFIVTTNNIFHIEVNVLFSYSYYVTPNLFEKFPCCLQSNAVRRTYVDRYGELH